MISTSFAAPDGHCVPQSCYQGRNYMEEIICNSDDVVFDVTQSIRDYVTTKIYLSNTCEGNITNVNAIAADAIPHSYIDVGHNVISPFVKANCNGQRPTIELCLDGKD